MRAVALALLGLCACAAPGAGRHGGPAGSAPAAIDYDAAARDARALLTALVAADTTSPPGNEARAVALGVERLRRAGIPYEVTEFGPGRQNVVARLRGDGSAPPLLLLAHTDVVGAEGQSWSTSPHVVTERDGYLIGRGVDDDLGMAALGLEVLLLLHETRVPLARDVILAWTGDEESGGAGIRWLLAHRPDAVRAALALNEGGSPVLGDDGRVRFVSLQTAEKSYQDYGITARGPTGHSSVPLADNAIYRLAAGLERLGRQRFPARLLPVTRAYLAARAGVEEGELARAMRVAVRAPGAIPPAALAVLDRDPLLAASLRTTCVATTVTGGTRRNALPADAVANVNCRILPDESVADVQATLARVLRDPELVIRPTEEFAAAAPSPLEGEGPAAIRRVADAMWPGAPIVPFMSRVATDSRFLRDAGIPAYGLSPIPTTEADARRAHGADERIPLASLRTGVEFLHRLVLELAAR
ncbi:MAG TPA: M20/M25/M40 family metallo-hydrolase [Candidatus Binatia bacterium]|jgi:acetylornithine deacetylase/succinyl-diaminopimelate desuccinylase-like protein